MTVQEYIETIYRPMASVEQSDLEFLVPADIDLNMRMYVKDKMVKEDWMSLDSTVFTALAHFITLYHSFFSHFSTTLNETNITQATELFPYLSYLETILTYCTDVANGFWYMDRSDL